MASRCCCTHITCECGTICEKHYSRCDSCRHKREMEAWFSKPEVEWDVTYPVALANIDEYFFDAESLIDYVSDHFPSQGIDEIADELMLTSCSQNRPRPFEINEWCCDELGEDSEVPDAASIDARINEIIGEIGTLSFSANRIRLNVRQILTSIGYGQNNDVF